VVTLRKVGVRELKAHLSEYIRAARDGEEIIITERGKDAAMLTSASHEMQVLRDLMAQGIVQWSGRKPDISQIEGIEITGEPLSKTVTDLRGPR
jgi:prevent-host-death family protein